MPRRDILQVVSAMTGQFIAVKHVVRHNVTKMVRAEVMRVWSERIWLLWISVL